MLVMEVLERFKALRLNHANLLEHLLLLTKLILPQNIIISL